MSTPHYETLPPSDAVTLGERAQRLISSLATLTDEPGRITRHYLSPAHRRATDLVGDWMRAAGLAVSLDALGTVRGRQEARRAGPSSGKRLLIGSHIDTVTDGGAYDGNFGVVAGILAVDELRRRRVSLPFGIEVLAFGDEEGVRFPTTLASSSAVAGAFNPAFLDRRDAAGVSLREALVAFGCDPDAIPDAACDPDEILGYLEVHIEQGPVLEHEKLPLGVVTSIAGQSRFKGIVLGEAGHAGTAPMNLRRDALAAAAEIMGEIERIARAGRDDSLVATVGQLAVTPGAVNVIPARVDFSLDIRAASDAPRLAAIAEIRARAREIGERRHVAFLLEGYHESPTTPCAPQLQAAFAAGIDALGQRVLRLTSGAGHDGHAIHHLTGVGMLFVRCRRGISHNPLEFAEPADMGLAVEALIGAILALARDEDGERS
ncbi:allantoate amidohydrolase [Methylobrevis pamukkalensis]|uniref:N-carbamoyl-L-amino acid hydrolase n=1 Tax=Methylobrevis pamukkalensis TaxID=1439726 RepID=A0A1E3H2A7_9HYPH|nr:allantoate amidohydrolase [Methylobrevis pamukkalensis]ODN69671.1 N-carbamoyl-L-amino acid hydrolase [Methylobrevis pamukkalensis]